jgi:hypothetical protein
MTRLFSILLPMSKRVDNTNTKKGARTPDAEMKSTQTTAIHAFKGTHDLKDVT